MKYNQAIPPFCKKLFYNWLKQQNLLSNYLTNMKICGVTVRSGKKPYFYQYINESFCWAKTNEGYEFWLHKQTEWYCYARRYLKTHSNFRRKFKQTQMIV